jgi:hypothetical protein
VTSAWGSSRSKWSKTDFFSIVKKSSLQDEVAEEGGSSDESQVGTLLDGTAGRGAGSRGAGGGRSSASGADGADKAGSAGSDSLGASSAESNVGVASTGSLGESTSAGDGGSGHGGLVTSGAGAVSLGLVGVAVASEDVDALVGTVRALGPGVVGGTLDAVAVVLDGDGLVVGQERSAGEVGVTTSPLDSTLGSILAASNPGSELDLHGSLGEASTVLGIGVVQGADQVAINVPLDVLAGPVDGVGVEVILGVADGVVGTTVIGGGISLAEVVGLDLGGITTEPLPVNLVKIVGLEDEAGNNTLTSAGLQGDVNLAEEDPLVGLDGGSLGLLADAEDSTLSVIVGDGGTLELLEKVVGALGEVNRNGSTQSRVIGAGCDCMLVLECSSCTGAGAYSSPWGCSW